MFLYRIFLGTWEKKFMTISQNFMYRFLKSELYVFKKNSMNFSERNINLRMFLDFDRNISVFWLKNSDSLFDFAFYVSRGTFQKKSYNNQNCSRFFPKNLGPLWKVSGSFVKTAFYLSKAILKQKKFEKKNCYVTFFDIWEKIFHLLGELFTLVCTTLSHLSKWKI